MEEIIEEIAEEPETIEEKLERAQKHFTSKDQLIPFIPLNPMVDPEEWKPFSEDEELENNKDCDPTIDYEKVLDPDFGHIPRQIQTPILQEEIKNHQA